MASMTSVLITRVSDSKEGHHGSQLCFRIFISTISVLFILSVLSFTLPLVASNTTPRQILGQSNEINNISNNEFQQYENLPFKVGLKYPPGWVYDEEIDTTGDWRDIQIHSYHNIVLFYVPGHVDDFGVQVLIGRLADETLEQYTRDHIAFYASDRDNFELLESDVNSTLSNSPAYRIIYSDKESGRNDPSTKFDYVWLDIGTIKDRMIFYVQFYAKPQYYSEYLPVAQEMIKSFEILDTGTISSPSSSVSALASKQFTTYRNYSGYGMEVSYPVSWTVDDSLAGSQAENIDIKFESPRYASYNENIVLSRKTMNDNHADLNLLAAERIQSYRQDPYYSSSFTLISSDTHGSDRRLLGLPSYEIVYTILNPRGGSDIILNNEIGTVIGEELYTITYSALISSYPEYTHILKKMIDSLKVYISDDETLQELQKPANVVAPEV